MSALLRQKVTLLADTVVVKVGTRVLTDEAGRLSEERIATLASVRELVSMIHLAKFTGEPASRADELVTQIAAAVEGLSEVATWSESPAA